MNLEEVHWVDSGWNFAHHWETLDEIEQMAKTWNGHSMTVGYVIYESDDRIVLVQTLDGDRPNGANAMLIYKENIIERRELT